MMQLVLEQHIVTDSGIRGGKPHIAGTRITVSDIVVWHFRLGRSLEEIAIHFDVPLAATYAAIAYYFDHKEDIDQEIEIQRVYYEEMKAANPSLLDQKLAAPDSV